MVLHRCSVYICTYMCTQYLVPSHEPVVLGLRQQDSLCLLESPGSRCHFPTMAAWGLPIRCGLWWWEGAAARGHFSAWGAGEEEVGEEGAVHRRPSRRVSRQRSRCHMLFSGGGGTLRKEVGENSPRGWRTAGPEAGGECEAGEGSGGMGGTTRCLGRRAGRSTAAVVATEAAEGRGGLPGLAEGRIPRKGVRAWWGGCWWALQAGRGAVSPRGGPWWRPSGYAPRWGGRCGPAAMSGSAVLLGVWLRRAWGSSVAFLLAKQKSVKFKPFAIPPA